MIAIPTSPFLFAWRHAHRVPDPLLRAGFTLGADYTWWRHSGGVRRLEANLRRVQPDATDREIRQLSRAGMRSYMRYYREVFTLAHLTPDTIRSRVRVLGADALRAEYAAGNSTLVALGHTGNWDLAGAWAGLDLTRVLTVAERLEPPELFEEFLAFRNSIGIDILALGDVGVFRDLTRAAESGGRLIPLLADRDLTASGVEVDLFGERARVAAGPAALTAATGAPLFVAVLSYERIYGEDRRAAKSPWRLVIDFQRVEIPEVPRPEQIEATTQAWVDLLARGIAASPQDWHMLQRVFVKDLDQSKDAHIRSQSTTSGEPAQ